MGRSRRIVMLASLGAVLCTAAGVTAAPSQPTVSLRVLSKLPGWLAPGGRLDVAGHASPGAQLALVVGSRTVASARADSAGDFTLAGRVGGAGPSQVAVRVAGAIHTLGTLNVRPVVLDAVGDVTFAGPVAAAIEKRGPRYPWLRVAAELRRADIATANLECVVSRRGSPVSFEDKPPPRLRGAPSSLRPAIRYAGIDVFTVANNHTLDYGPDAFADTISSVHEFGAAAVGGGPTLTAARAPVFLSRGGLRIAFLGYDDTWPPFHANLQTPGSAPADPTMIAEDVRAARTRADLVVVWFHWGVQYSTEASDRQRELAAAALGAGASVVLGAHPHVLEPVESQPGQVTAWSLGNFVFYLRTPLSGNTGILQVKLGAQGVISSRLLPAAIHGVQPRLLKTQAAT